MGDLQFKEGDLVKPAVGGHWFWVVPDGEALLAQLVVGAVDLFKLGMALIEGSSGIVVNSRQLFSSQHRCRLQYCSVLIEEKIFLICEVDLELVEEE